MKKEPTGDMLMDKLEIPEDRQAKVIGWVEKFLDEDLRTMKFKDEGSLCKHITDEVIKQEFTTTEAVFVAYKVGGLYEILFPKAGGELMRLMFMLGRGGDEQEE